MSILWQIHFEGFAIFNVDIPSCTLRSVWIMFVCIELKQTEKVTHTSIRYVVYEFV